MDKADLNFRKYVNKAFNYKLLTFSAVIFTILTFFFGGLSFFARCFEMQLWSNSQFYCRGEFLVVLINLISILFLLVLLFVACHSFLFDSKLIAGFHFRFPVVHKLTLSLLIIFNCLMIPLFFGSYIKFSERVALVFADKHSDQRVLIKGHSNHVHPIWSLIFTFAPLGLLVNLVLLIVPLHRSSIHAIPKLNKRLKTASKDEQLELLQDLIVIEFFYKRYDAVELHSKKFLELCQASA